MDIGMNLPVMVPGLDRDLLLTWARRIDAGPFSTLAAGERVSFPNPDVMVALAAAAAVTTRVRIMTNVVVLPMQRLTVDVVADNPGEWMLHCHNTYHQEAGMMTSLNYVA